MSTKETAAVRDKLKQFPRADLCHRSTPLEFMPNLTKHLGGPSLYIKRDDCTGLATGGNKARKLDFLIGEALARNADVVLTQGAVQSNHVRQTAAAAAKYGMACEVLLERRVPNTADDYENSGNVLLDRILSVSIDYRRSGTDMNQALVERANELEAKGKKPYVIPGGGSNSIGALGYVDCAAEIVDQAKAHDLKVDWIVHGTGSTGTQAGLLVGLAVCGGDTRLLGVSVRQPRERQIEAVWQLTKMTGDLLKIPVARDNVLVEDGYVGGGYGIPTPEMVEALQLTARKEGVFLDPVYSGKGMAGLIDLIRNGFFKKSDNIVFIHTGGAVGLFAYRDSFV